MWREWPKLYLENPPSPLCKETMAPLEPAAACYFEPMRASTRQAKRRVRIVLSDNGPKSEQNIHLHGIVAAICRCLTVPIPSPQPRRWHLRTSTRHSRTFCALLSDANGGFWALFPPTNDKRRSGRLFTNHGDRQQARGGRESSPKKRVLRGPRSGGPIEFEQI